MEYIEAAEYATVYYRPRGVARLQRCVFCDFRAMRVIWLAKKCGLPKSVMYGMCGYIFIYNAIIQRWVYIVTTPDVHFAVLAQHWTNYKIGVPRWKVTQSHTKVALGSPNSSKMSTTDYQQPSHLNEFRVHRDEDSETHAIPPGSPAERPVHININSYLRKIWRFATSTIVTQDSWGNPAIAAHSTTIHQR